MKWGSVDEVKMAEGQELKQSPEIGKQSPIP